MTKEFKRKMTYVNRFHDKGIQDKNETLQQVSWHRNSREKSHTSTGFMTKEFKRKKSHVNRFHYKGIQEKNDTRQQVS